MNTLLSVTYAKTCPAHLFIPVTAPGRLSLLDWLWVSATFIMLRPSSFGCVPVKANHYSQMAFA